jgi:hypothetical protein
MITDRIRSLRRRLPGVLETTLHALLLLYVGSYAILSRRAFAVADATNAEGIYFVEPSSDAGCRLHELCSTFFYPLLVLDNLLGTGRPAASCPLKLTFQVDSATADGGSSHHLPHFGCHWLRPLVSTRLR